MSKDTKHKLDDSSASKDELQVLVKGLDLLPNPVVITDDVPKIIYANQSWFKMTGYTPQEALGKNPSELVKSGEMEDNFYTQMWSTLLMGKTWEGQLINRRKNGHFYTEYMKISPMRIGKKNYFIALKEDIHHEDKILKVKGRDLHRLFESSSPITVMLNPKAEIEYINSNGAQLLGYNAYEIIGKNWFNLTADQKEMPRLKSIFNGIIKGDLAYAKDYTNRIKTKQGNYRHIHWQNEFLTDEKGNISGSISSGWDITDLLSKTQQIERQKNLLAIERDIGKLINQKHKASYVLKESVELIFKNTHVSGVWIVFNEKDKEVQFYQKGFNNTEFDQKIQTLFQSRNKIACPAVQDGFKLYKIQHKKACHACPMNNTEFEGNMAVSWQFETYKIPCNICIVFDKEIELSSMDTELVQSTLSLIKAYIEHMHTEKRKDSFESELRQTEEKQNFIFQNNNLSANYITSPDGKIINCNRAFLDLLELQSLEEAQKFDPEHFFPKSFKRSKFIERLKKEGVIENWERRYYTKGHKAITVLENTLGHFDAQGNLTEINGFLVDISELKQNEKRLKEALNKAQESERLKAAFLSNISHEIRTPMNHIMGFAHILKDQALDEKTRNNLLSTIEKSGEKLVRMISEIIDLSKIDAKQLTLHPTYFDLNILLSKLIHEYRDQIKEEKPKLSIVCSNDLSKPMEIFSDRSRFQQIVENLLSNAVKFSHQGEIRLGYRLQNDKLHFNISDQGIGIKRIDLNNIFKRFIKNDHPDYKNLGGTGLGLALVEELVQLMSGKVKVESEFGKGTRFSFSISSVITKEQVKLEEKSIKKDSLMKDLKILIAEDDESNFQLLNILLKPLHPQVFRAWNGLEAIDIAKNQELDLILMDLKMPDMDGYIATREIKSIHPTLPIIAQTAYAMIGDKEKALESGCDYYISKPIKHQKLKEIIQSALMKNQL